MNRSRPLLSGAVTMLLLLGAATAHGQAAADPDESYRVSAVVIQSEHPIRRPRHDVVVARPGENIRTYPSDFMPIAIWDSTVAERPGANRVVWRDSEALRKDDDWSSIVFNSDQKGERLFIEILDGRVQFDFVEIVFENGDCQVIDFMPKAYEPGYYQLAELKSKRKLDHVRVVARAKTADSRVDLALAR